MKIKGNFFFAPSNEKALDGNTPSSSGSRRTSSLLPGAFDRYLAERKKHLAEKEDRKQRDIAYKTWFKEGTSRRGKYFRHERDIYNRHGFDILKTPKKFYAASVIAYNPYWDRQPSLPKLPERLTCFYMYYGGGPSECDMTEFPEIPKYTKSIGVRGCSLTDFPVVPKSLTYLDLSNNSFTTVPRHLLNGSDELEIDMRGNPLSRAEIEAIQREVRIRRAGRRPVPTFRFDELPPPAQTTAQRRRAADDLSGLDDTNVHMRKLVGVFRTQLESLITQFPDLYPPGKPQDFDQLQTRLIVELRACARRCPDLFVGEDGTGSVLATAETSVQMMCDQGKRGETAFDFGASGSFRGVTAGHVLGYVHRFIRNRPEAERDVGLAQLAQHLRLARGYCSTRHVEEALSALRSAYLDDPGVVQEAPFAEAQALMLDETKRILPGLLAGAGKRSLGAVQADFRAELRNGLREHRNVTERQIKDFETTVVIPNWDTLCDVVGENGSPADDGPQAASQAAAASEWWQSAGISTRVVSAHTVTAEGLGVVPAGHALAQMSIHDLWGEDTVSIPV